MIIRKSFSRKRKFTTKRNKKSRKKVKGLR